MTDWLKLTLQYLYRVRGSIFLHLASCFSIALIASLYHIPIQAIGYMILFISSMALLFLGIGCHQFRLADAVSQGGLERRGCPAGDSPAGP